MYGFVCGFGDCYKKLYIWIAKHFEETITAKMLLSRISVAIFLAAIIIFVDGNQTIVHVSELLGEARIGTFCCVYGNCSCNSLDYALSHLTSNVLINITTDVTLSSLTKPSNLENVSIVGHNNPIMNCTNVGGIHFTFCHNCIILGITWHGCGSKNVDTNVEPGLQLRHSSNITIQNCSFQHSIGQAVVLSEILGDVNINHCHFVYNSHYQGHGAAVNNIISHPQHSFKINNCSFTYNKGAKSLVYIENKISEDNISMSFCHFKFCHNQGTSIYLINQRLNLCGNLSFLNNKAEYGAGIHISNKSSVIFGKELNCSV